jgi:hypothetical protein
MMQRSLPAMAKRLGYRLTVKRRLRQAARGAPPRWSWWSSPCRRRRPKEHNSQSQCIPLFVKSVQLPAVVRNEIVELLAQALVKDFMAYPPYLIPGRHKT